MMRSAATMDGQSGTNKRAWSCRAYEYCISNLGLPNDVAKDMMKQPNHYLRRQHIEYLGDVNGKKIANLLGSHGRKAVPLAILGADVTIVDISEENKRYAMELADAAGVHLSYIVADFAELNTDDMRNSYDITYLEGGILHYFSDLDQFAQKIYGLLKMGGRLVLNDFHPIRKIFKVRDIFEDRDDSLVLTGDYFEDELVVGEVAYGKYFPDDERKELPRCLLRYWTMGEIISAFASSGFVIEGLVEGPRFDRHKNIPGEFTMVASKLKVDR